jgi:peptidoglycan-associated lipoprotein
MFTLRTALSLSLTSLIALSALSLAGCGEKRPAGSPTATSAPTLTNAALESVSPNISVSEDIAHACKLHVHDLDTAPKFDFDKSDLLTADRNVLMKVAECLTTGPLKGRSIQLIGRADPRGEPQYNMALGANRASHVVDYLAGAGLDRTHADVTSRGELDAVGIDEGGWQTDRRVDIVLVKK